MFKRVRSDSELAEYQYYSNIRQTLTKNPISQKIIELARAIFQEATEARVWKKYKADAEGLIQSAVRELASSRASSSSSSSDSPIFFEKDPVPPKSPKKSALSDKFSPAAKK